MSLTSESWSKKRSIAQALILESFEQLAPLIIYTTGNTYLKQMFVHKLSLFWPQIIRLIQELEGPQVFDTAKELTHLFAQPLEKGHPNFNSHQNLDVPFRLQPAFEDAARAAGLDELAPKIKHQKLELKASDFEGSENSSVKSKNRIKRRKL